MRNHGAKRSRSLASLRHRRELRRRVVAGTLTAVDVRAVRCGRRERGGASRFRAAPPTSDDVRVHTHRRRGSRREDSRRTPIARRFGFIGRGRRVTAPAGSPVLEWRVTVERDRTVAHFRLTAPSGVFSPEDLRSATLPSELVGRRQFGLVLSGRGPVFLFATLLHEAHVFAWVAIFDPRLGAVVVQRHRADAPEVGTVLSVPTESVA